jgi:hypothetical protein
MSAALRRQQSFQPHNAELLLLLPLQCLLSVLPLQAEDGVCQAAPQAACPALLLQQTFGAASIGCSSRRAVGASAG